MIVWEDTEMKIETYFHPRMRRMKPVYRGKSMFADHFVTKGDSKSHKRHERKVKDKDT